MPKFKDFISYAKANYGLDDHDLMLVGDKFRNPKIQAKFVNWHSANNNQSEAQTTHYHASAPI